MTRLRKMMLEELQRQRLVSEFLCVRIHDDMLWFTLLRQLQLRWMLHYDPARPIAWRPDFAHVVVNAVPMEDQLKSALRVDFLQRYAVDKDIELTISAAKRQQSWH